MGTRQVCAECGLPAAAHGSERGAAKGVDHKFVPAEQRADGESQERRPASGSGFENR